MKKSFLLLLVILSSNYLFAQKDSTTLNIEEFLEIVRQYHPAVKLSNIDIKRSEADILIARGAFNPIISNITSNKTFLNTEYYNYFNPNITIPLWYGVDIMAGVENLSGNRIDPTETFGKSSYLGISIPLIKNLVIQKRSAYLMQAKLYKEMTYTEQIALINNIMMEAASQYWQWVNAYQNYQIVDKNLSISLQRFEMIKKMWKNGERPSIDTIEAMTQLQIFESQKNESWLIYQSESIAMSAFLWKANNTPYQLPANTMPQQGWENESNIEAFQLNLTDLKEYARQFHPELKIYSQKFEVLGIDKKLKFQELLPELDFKYNHLSKGYNAFNTDGIFFQNNFQYGFKLEMPLLFSQGRGEYKKVKLKIEENKINQSQKLQNIELKIQNYHNEFVILKNQVKLHSAMLSNFKTMLKAEESLFRNGESSLFLINSRENKVLEIERKLIELKTKYYKTIYALQWSTGLLK
ncbi:MAG TPA: TolC family protein [Saprospiraceae bacterium]|nr:TolC family protein [Saprospiraceae bacterium]